MAKKRTPAYIRKLRLIGFLFLLPAAIMIIYTTVIPFVWNVYISFGKWDGVSAYQFVGFKNYMMSGSKPNYKRA